MNAPTPYERPWWPLAAESAFARWCAEQDLMEDYDAPHGQAFLAGWFAMATYERAETKP